MHVISSILVSGILASSTETVSCPLGIRIGTRTAAPLTTCAIKAADRKTDGQTDRQRETVITVLSSYVTSMDSLKDVRQTAAITRLFLSNDPVSVPTVTVAEVG